MTTPFVNFRMQPTQNVSSTPFLIFGNDLHTCEIDGITLANLTESSIVVTLSVSREVEVGTDTNFIYLPEALIKPMDRLEVMQGTTLRLEAGDLLYARSDNSDSFFNTFVNYRELQELP